MKKAKSIILLSATVAVFAGLVAALRPAPLPVSAVVAERGRFVEFVEEEGRTALRSPHTMSAPIGGHLRRVELETGDRVGAGDPLFEIEPGPAPSLDARTLERARAEAGAAEARLRVAEANLETRDHEARYAEREYERNRVLRERKAVSEAQLESWRDRRDRARSARRAAESALETARFELRNARAVLDVAQGQREATESSVLRIRSPLAGRILARHRWDEGAVTAGEPVLEIGDLARLEVRVDLLSMDAVRVREGTEVLLTRWGGDRDLPGRVRLVEPAGFERISALGVEEQRVPVWVVVQAPREDWESLGAGYRVEARFVLWEADDVLQVPTGALFRRDDQWMVFTVRDRRAWLRPVEPGRRSGLWTQVLSGLEAGETVITHPGDRVEDGRRVRPEVRSYR